VIDADRKLIISYDFSDTRGADSALALMDDLRGRVANRVHLATDGRPSTR